MPNNPEKIVGNSGRCFKCNDPIYCREKEYKGNKSAQWQDKEGKAHYNKDGSCKGGSVNNGPSAPSTPQVDLSEYKPEVVTPAQEALFVDLVVRSAEYTLIAQRELQKFTEIQNPALKGLVTKLAMNMMDKVQGGKD